jgi:hypothetical protein
VGFGLARGALSSDLCAPIIGVTRPSETRVPRAARAREEVTTVAYRDDDDRSELVRLITLIMLMLAVLSTYTDLVGFFRG